MRALPLTHATAVVCCEVKPKWLQMNRKDPIYCQSYHLSSIQWPDTKLVPHNNTLCSVKRQTESEQRDACKDDDFICLRQ